MTWTVVAIAAAAPGALLEPEAAVLWVAEDPTGVNFGWAVADVPDLDGDGVTDVVTGDPFASTSAGVTVVLSGATGAEVHRIVGAPGAVAGYAVSEAGDIDGDGVADFVSGAPGNDTAVVYSGASGAVLHTLGSLFDESFGAAVAAVGDVDGDGVGDLVVGATRAAVAAVDAGRAYLFSGADGSVLWTADGEDEGGLLGSGAGPLGDVTGDGVPDVVVGAAGAPGGGRVYVLDGLDGNVVHRLEDPVGGGSLGSFFVSGVGDVDGDGVPDVFGGDYAEGSLGYGTGRFTVWSGATGAQLYAVSGDAAGEGLGTGRYAGDADGDGVPDLAVGSWTSSVGATSAGRVGVYSGVDGALLRTVTSTTAGETFGFDVIGLGDVDQDGEIDLLVSAASANRVYLIGTAAATTTTTTTPSTDTGTGETPTDTDTDTDTGGPKDTGGPEEGCGCRQGPAAAGWWALIGLLALRPARAAARGGSAPSRSAPMPR